MAFPFSLVGHDSHDYYGHSVTIGLASRRQSRVPSQRNVLERLRLPTHVLECLHWASSLGQGVPRAKTELVASESVGVQTCYRRVCGSTPGHWDSGNSALAISLRRCRATPYTSSVVLCFINMLLSPRPFGSRSVVHLRVITLNSGHF